jgi:hypothetical protein
MNYLPGLASNHNPPDLCLLSSWDYRREPLAPSFICLHRCLETRCHDVAQADLELMILLPEPSECQDKCVSMRITCGVYHRNPASEAEAGRRHFSLL